MKEEAARSGPERAVTMRAMFAWLFLPQTVQHLKGCGSCGGRGGPWFAPALGCPAWQAVGLRGNITLLPGAQEQKQEVMDALRLDGTEEPGCPG